MIIEVLTFGMAKEITGSKCVQVEMGHGSTAGDLVQVLKAMYPALQTLKALAVAVNNEYAGAEMVISAGDEVAIIPPVSGG